MAKSERIPKPRVRVTRNTRTEVMSDGWLNGKQRRQEEKAEIEAEIDEILDEIDEALEQNAEEFIQGYVQKGGE